MKPDEEESDSDTDLPSNVKKVKKYKVVGSIFQEVVENDTFPCNIIIDSGTETIIGHPAWSICQRYKQSLSMSDVDNSMNCISMHCCNAITVVLNGNGQAQLIGVRRGVYLPSLTDDVTVVNSHLIRETG
eukprot:1619873-Ditylum_brightwellii.AAC.1